MKEPGLNILIFKNTLREYGRTALLEKLFIHDFLNILILSSLGLVGQSWTLERIIEAYPYFIFLSFFSSGLAPWQSESWNHMSAQLNTRSFKLVFSRMLTGLCLSCSSFLLISLIILFFSKKLSVDLTFVCIYALSGLISGASIGLLSGLKHDKIISNIAQASMWILALGRGMLLKESDSFLLRLLPGALLESAPALEAAKMIAIPILLFAMLWLREHYFFEQK